MDRGEVKERMMNWCLRLGVVPVLFACLAGCGTSETEGLFAKEDHSVVEYLELEVSIFPSRDQIFDAIGVDFSGNGHLAVLTPIETYMLFSRDADAKQNVIRIPMGEYCQLFDTRGMNGNVKKLNCTCERSGSMICLNFWGSETWDLPFSYPFVVELEDGASVVIKSIDPHEPDVIWYAWIIVRESKTQRSA